MFRNSLSWYILALSLLDLIIKTHPTLHDSSHGKNFSNSILMSSYGMTQKTSYIKILIKLLSFQVLSAKIQDISMRTWRIYMRYPSSICENKK